MVDIRVGENDSWDREPFVHEFDGWKWINRCPVCGEEAVLDDDDLWWCRNGHHADYPNEEIVERPAGGGFRIIGRGMAPAGLDGGYS